MSTVVENCKLGNGRCANRLQMVSVRGCCLQEGLFENTSMGMELDLTTNDFIHLSWYDNDMAPSSLSDVAPQSQLDLFVSRLAAS